jgi:hypothetical protein
MRSTKLAAVGLALVGVLGLSCAAPADKSESFGAPGSSASTEGAPSGFDDWLRSQCPNGAAVALEDPRTGELIHFVPCEDLRERALADSSGRASLVQAYEARTDKPEEGESIGQAREPLTPLGGLVCAIVSLGPGLIFGWPGRGCEHARTPEDRRACEATIGGFSTGATMLCALSAFF